jgi:cysteine-rich repeat protein
MRVFFRSMITVVVASLLAAPQAFSQVQNADEQGCINAMNGNGAKVAKAQGKNNAGCIKGAGKNDLPSTADVCLTADEKGKIAKAAGKTTAAQASECTDVPGFAFTAASTVNDAAEENEVELTRDVFGATVQSAIIDGSTDAVGANCQASVAKGYEKIAAAAIKEFTSCKKAGLAAGTITNADGVESCVGTDPKGKVGTARDKLQDTATKKCPGVDLTAAFPGCGAGTSADLADCAAQAVRCRTCIMANGMDGLTAQCDLLDNGANDGSCAECGNGIQEIGNGEFCDDGGETLTCDANCSPVSCGDGDLNTTAGEECEDGNVLENDGCAACRITSCGDGLLCNNPACTTGPGGGPEECDLGANNGSGGCSLTCALTAADAQCPTTVDVTTYPTTGRTCTTNADCPVGTCDGGLGRCLTVTDRDRGWTGIAHDGEGNDGFRTRVKLSCAGPDPGCGECVMTGVDPEPGNCRCANNNQTTCDEPLQADADDCGGALCNCYVDAPMPWSIGNVPICFLERLVGDVTGTLDVDSGATERSDVRRSAFYLGESLYQPCPSCGGTCTAPAGNVGDLCAIDADCDTGNATGDGVCGNYDPVAGDGLAQGKCFGGNNEGQSCDIAVMNASFPAPGGGGHSLDCFPSNGFNISGFGARLDAVRTTGSSSLSADVECGIPPFVVLACPCGVCNGNSQSPCASNADCLAGTCGAPDSDDVFPNTCDDGVCTPIGGDEGQCNAGPTDKSCDGITRANGKGFINCFANADCDAVNIGEDAGNCSLSELRPCLPDPTTASGSAHPTKPVVAALSCTASSSNGSYNIVVGAPGPDRVREQEKTQATCSDGTTPYTAGGSCP